MTGDETLKLLAAPMQVALASRGITMSSLAQDHKRELKAKETKIIKVKRGAIDIAKLPVEAESSKCKAIKPRGYRIIMATADEIVIAVDFVAWGVRQNARMDAQKLLNLYPAEKREVSFPKPLIVVNDAANRESITE